MKIEFTDKIEEFSLTTALVGKKLFTGGDCYKNPKD